MTEDELIRALEIAAREATIGEWISEPPYLHARRFLAMIKAYEEVRDRDEQGGDGDDDLNDPEAFVKVRERIRAAAKALPKS